jgi:hypothetical protein
VHLVSAYSEGRESEPAYFGSLQSALPYAPTTMSLKTSVQTMPIGERPIITLEPTDHPLSLEQQHGITMAQVQQIAEAAFICGDWLLLTEFSLTEVATKNSSA